MSLQKVRDLIRAIIVDGEGASYADGPSLDTDAEYEAYDDGFDNGLLYGRHELAKEILELLK